MAETLPEQAQAFPPGSFSERLLAFGLDFLIFSLTVGLFAVRFLHPEPGSWAEAALGAAIVAAFLLYHTLLDVLPGQTPGKWAAGVRVASLAENSWIKPARSLLRSLGYLVSAFPLGLGFLWAAFSVNHRAWHDLIARTVVLRVREKGRVLRWVLAAAAWALAGSLALGALYGQSLRVAEDTAAVNAARDAARELGQLEDNCKLRHGAYLDDPYLLVITAPNAAAVLRDVPPAFVPDSVRITLNASGYRVQGIARDSRRTPVVFEGPSPFTRSAP